MKPHPEALTAEQQAVLAASHEITGRWGAYLAGGSALAVHLGHRRSVDLDWFTKSTVKPADLIRDVESLGFPVSVRQNDEGTFLGHVGEVQYSVFRYRYDLVAPPTSYEGCSLAALEDIAAMKMTAIVQRATKRDYVDLHAMLVGAKLPMRKVLATMRRKYTGLDPSESLRALGYFKDVEKQAMPDMITKTTWEEVKKGLTQVCERELQRNEPDR